jgi:hypothetical protein
MAWGVMSSGLGTPDRDGGDSRSREAAELNLEVHMNLG